MDFTNIFQENIVIILIIFIIILIFIIPLITINNICNKSISGLWEVDNSFASEAGIDRFLIYFESGKENICWILISTKENILINHITNYKLTTDWTILDNISFNIDTPRKFNIKFNDLPDNISDTFPIKQTIQLDYNFGRLSLINEKKISFTGYKNFHISNLIHSDINNNSIIKEEQNDDIFI